MKKYTYFPFDSEELYKVGDEYIPVVSFTILTSDFINRNRNSDRWTKTSPGSTWTKQALSSLGGDGTIWRRPILKRKIG